MATVTRKILIIDDNPDDLEFYSELLSRVEAPHKYMVYTADNFQDAEKLFNTHNIACTLVDYNMPEDDGLSVISQLQRSAGSFTLPIILLTGEPHQKIQAEAARQGAMDYVTKEMMTSPAQLDKVIGKVIDWSKALKDQQK